MAGWFRRSRDGDGAASGILGDLIEVFQPSRRHVEAERERRQQHAQIPETGAPPFHVDLDRGVAYLSAPAQAPGPGLAGDAPAADTDRPGPASSPDDERPAGSPAP